MRPNEVLETRSETLRTTSTWIVSTFIITSQPYYHLHAKIIITITIFVMISVVILIVYNRTSCCKLKFYRFFLIKVISSTLR